jgi:hypothetical protein
VVEAQHQVSTRKLVDGADEQVLLEEMIDRVKPPAPAGAGLHYLLFTPFRYPPLPHGSRFGTRIEPGIWYGSRELRTAFAEVAYYRLLFLEGSGATMGVVTTSLTAFTAPLRTSRGVDLSRPPFDAFRSEIASPSTYVSSQSLGRAMRDARVEAFRYPSARDREGGVNVAALVPSVFGSGQPRSLETWYCAATREGVDVSRADFLRKQRFDFPRAHFLVRGKLPAPAI